MVVYLLGECGVCVVSSVPWDEFSRDLVRPLRTSLLCTGWSPGDFWGRGQTLKSTGSDGKSACFSPRSNWNTASPLTAKGHSGGPRQQLSPRAAL